MKEYKVVEVSFEKESTYYLIKSRTVNPSLIERIFGYGKWYTATDGAGDNIRKYKTEEEAKETITKHIKKKISEADLKNAKYKDVWITSH